MLYEKILSKDEINQLKASNIRDLKKEENLITGVLAIALVCGFAFFVACLAMIIWSSALTLFIAGVTAMPFLFFYWSYHKILNEYKKTLKEYQEELKSQEKHAL